MSTIFAALDAELQPIEVFPGVHFTTSWKRADDDADADYLGVAIGEYGARELPHAVNALELYTADDLERFRIMSAAAPSPPDGQVLVGYSLSVVDGALVVTPTFSAAPVFRREVPKSVIQARLIDAGKMDTVFTALMSSPADFAKWFAPDWPNVFADDERMLEVLTAVGADVEAITAP